MSQYSSTRVAWALLVLCALWTAAALAAPNVTLVSNAVIETSGVYFVSYDGLVNVESFQESAVTTYAGYQYAVWYSSSNYAHIARRALPSGSWTALQLPHQLVAQDSHNVISVGVSPADGTIHIALDCHSTPMYYIQSQVGLANSPASKTWAVSSFGAVQSTLGGLNLGSTVTYPQFVVTPDNKLQLVYRSGVSGNGATQLAEYTNGVWANVGSWASATGSYTSDTGAVSTARNLYIHGFTYSASGRAHVSGTWRENNAAVSCSSTGLTNHDTVYIYSDDRGRTWHNNVGTQVGTSGSAPVSVTTSGLIVDPLDANHALMNQESQATDSASQPHIIISYVPGRFTQCVPDYETGRVANAYAFHVFRSTSGAWTKFEIPFPVQCVGRSQIFMDASDTVFVVLPFLRIVAATKAANWTDWTLAYDGRAAGLNVFGEVTLDRRRLLTENVLSVLYQEASSGGPSPVHVVDFQFS